MLSVSMTCSIKIRVIQAFNVKGIMYPILWNTRILHHDIRPYLLAIDAVFSISILWRLFKTTEFDFMR